MHDRHVLLKRRYPARGNDGRTYEVHVYVETALDDIHGKNSHALIEHLALLATADGQKLEVLGKGCYRIVETDVILYAHDPQAV